MKTASFASRLLATAVTIVAAVLSSAGIAEAAQDPLIGFWLAKIDGETEARSLIIKEAAPTSEGVLLSARYGMSSQGTSPVEAKAVQNGSQRQFVLITQAGSKIIAAEDSAGRLVGTFSLKNGATKNIVITRSTEEDLQRLAQGKSAAKPIALVQPPGPGVPPNCAAFSGGWGGEWPVAGYASLWVVSVDTSCAVKYIYPAGQRPPKSADGAKEAVIKGNGFEIRRADGGTTTFELNGGAISARYLGPSGSNSTTLRRIDVDSAAQAQVDTDQRTALTVVPPGTDVPSECAAFYGQWAGTWSQGSFGELYFRVAEVKPAGDKCIVRYSYSTSKTPVPARETAEVRSGTITFVCNKGTGGTCVFERRGETLSASYRNPAGNSNDGTFKRVE